MTIKDIFAHLISWRFQFAAWVVLLTASLAIDAIWFADHFETFRAYLVDAELGALALLVLVNVVWTLIKLCIACPLIADIAFWCWRLDL